MTKFIQHILSENYTGLDDLINKHMAGLVSRKIVDLKKSIMAEMYAIEDKEMNEARFAIVKARIRNGKVQRRRKISTNSAFTFRKKGKGPAKLVRMSPLERRHRRLGAKRGKIKRRGKLTRIRQKLRKARLKRKSLGL